MIEKSSVEAFFNRAAENWDRTNLESPDIINEILDKAMLSSGTVLDVACGTGILFPYYLERNVSHLTGVDISPRMAELARRNHPDPRIEVYCGDIHTFSSARQYDHCVIFNAFPHLGRPAELFSKLASLLSRGGTLSVAHSMSRRQINRLHCKAARAVSLPLPPAEELAAWMEPWFSVKFVRSDEHMYQITAVKKERPTL